MLNCRANDLILHRARSAEVDDAFTSTISSSSPQVFIHKIPLNRDHDAFVAAFKDDNSASLRGRRDAISDLLIYLQGHPIAKRLKYLQQPVNAKLPTIYAQEQSETSDLSPFSPLTKLVATKGSDLEIWRTVLQLIADLARVTPPRSSIPPSFSGTPLRRSSASFHDSNQRREELRQHILMELAGRTYEDVSEFDFKYFEKKSWSEKVNKALEKLPSDDPLREFPDTLKPEEDEVWTTIFTTDA